jgi:hypothetical protein
MMVIKLLGNFECAGRRFYCCRQYRDGAVFLADALLEDALLEDALLEDALLTDEGRMNEH